MKCEELKDYRSSHIYLSNPLEQKFLRKSSNVQCNSCFKVLGMPLLNKINNSVVCLEGIVGAETSKIK